VIDGRPPLRSNWNRIKKAFGGVIKGHFKQDLGPNLDKWDKLLAKISSTLKDAERLHDDNTHYFSPGKKGWADQRAAEKMAKKLAEAEKEVMKLYQACQKIAEACGFYASMAQQILTGNDQTQMLKGLAKIQEEVGKYFEYAVDGYRRQVRAFWEAETQRNVKQHSPQQHSHWGYSHNAKARTAWNSQANDKAFGKQFLG